MGMARKGETMNKKAFRIAGWALGLSLAITGVGLAVEASSIEGRELSTVRAADGDEHDFAQSVSKLLNNDAAIDDIVIAQQTYAVKQIIISCRYNKSINPAVTISAKLGDSDMLVGDTSNKTVQIGNNFNDTITFAASFPAKGKITISFANETGSGTGHGTFYVTNVCLVEGIAGTQYTVEDSVEHGTITPSLIGENQPLNATLVPDSHYHLPSSLTSVVMGGTPLVAGSGYTYNNTSGEIYIASVTGNVVISGACEEDAKYAITYAKGEHGTGSDYVVADKYAGSYTLLTFADTGLRADSGFKFDHWDIGGTPYAPGASYSLSSNTTVTAVYVALANKLSITVSGFVNDSYADNNGAHTVGDYEVTTNAVMRGNSTHSEDLQFKKSEGIIYNTSIGFSHGIKMIKVVGEGVITVTFDTTLKEVAGEVASKTVSDNLGTKVRYYVPDTAEKCIYFHIKKGGTDTGYFSSIELYSAESAALEFAQMYLAAYTCVSTGASAPTETSGYTAANIKPLYDKLSSDVQVLLQNAVKGHTADYGTDKLKEFGERYYWIVKNHGEGYDFMSLSGTVSFAPTAFDFATNVIGDSAIPMIITILSGGIVAAGGIFLMSRRRRER